MQFSVNHIPVAVDTYEKLILWACSTLHFPVQGLEFKEREPSPISGDSGLQKVIETNGPFIAADGTPRKLYRLSLPLENDYESQGYAMTYEASKEITTAAATASFIA